MHIDLTVAVYPDLCFRFVMETIQVVGPIVLICLLSTMKTAPAAKRSEEDCDIFADYEVSPDEYFRHDVYCNQPMSVVPEHVEKVFISLNPPCSQLLQTDALIINSSALTQVYLHDSYNFVQILNDSSFHTLINVRELSLVGFGRLHSVTSGVF